MATGNGAQRAERGHDSTNSATQTSALPTLAANGRLRARSVRWAPAVATATVAAAATAVGAAAPGEALSIPTLRSTPRCGRESPSVMAREAAGAPKGDQRSNEVLQMASRPQPRPTRRTPAQRQPRGANRQPQGCGRTRPCGRGSGEKRRVDGPSRWAGRVAMTTRGHGMLCERWRETRPGCAGEGRGERGDDAKSSTPYGGDGNDSGRGGGGVAQREQSSSATKVRCFGSAATVRDIKWSRGHYHQREVCARWR